MMTRQLPITVEGLEFWMQDNWTQYAYQNGVSLWVNNVGWYRVKNKFEDKILYEGKYIVDAVEIYNEAI